MIHYKLTSTPLEVLKSHYFFHLIFHISRGIFIGFLTYPLQYSGIILSTELKQLHIIGIRFISTTLKWQGLSSQKLHIGQQFQKHCQRCNISLANWDERLLLISQVVAGRVTVFKTASLWHVLASWLGNLAHAFFQLEYPDEIYS